MKSQPKYQYGEVYEIAACYSVDVVGGEIEIVGIIRFDHLPGWLNTDQWLTGEAEDDWATITEPWYLYAYTEDEESNTFYIPEWALDFAFHEARKENIRRARANI